jgi:hypothetical protein
MMNRYFSDRAKAQQLLKWVRKLRIPCMGSAKLCGWDFASEDYRDVLSILASPDAYDSRLPEHTGEVYASHSE